MIKDLFVGEAYHLKIISLQPYGSMFIILLLFGYVVIFPIYFYN